ncbi:MAG: hypothetical protein ACI4U2_04385, partial [Christensenellaceae bacterium]
AFLMEFIDLKAQYRALQASDPDKAKILVLGDSSMAFAVDSAQLSSLTGMPCYTLGMQGGMGKEYIFELAKPYIREGDLVIFPFTGYSANYYGADLILLSLEHEPDLYWDYMAKHPFSALFRLKDRVMVKVKGLAEGKEDERGNDFYQSAAFDETGNLVFYRPSGRYASALENSAEQYFYEGMVSSLAINKINRYAAYCEKTGATFVLTAGPVYEKKVASSQEQVEAFEKWFRSKMDAPLIVEQWSDSFYEKKYMYDTAIHMSSPGMKVYTNDLYEDLVRGGFVS